MDKELKKHVDAVAKFLVKKTTGQWIDMADFKAVFDEHLPALIAWIKERERQEVD